jgi:phosphate transport system permease protein
MAGAGDRLFFFLTRLAAISVVVLAILLVIELVRGSWEAISKFGIAFLWGTTWDPVKEEFSTLPTIIGTVARALIALVLAVPVSIGSAIFIAYYAPRRLATLLSYLIESLASIPSVIFGLWGLFILVPIVRVVQVWLKANLGFIPLFSGPAAYGVGMFAGGLILAIMVTPIIAALSRDILRTVPKSQMEAMLALGGTKWESIWKVALPYARGGLIGATILGLGRALGETMAVTMVGGNGFVLAKSLFDPVHSMASQIAAEFSEATYSLYISSLVYVALVLFGITVIVNILAQWLILRTAGAVKSSVE